MVGEATAGVRSGVTRPRFQLVDSMRGLAALSVLLYHVTFFFGSPGTLVNWVTARVTGEPHPAVVVFFVISGFVLYRPFAEARLTGAPRPALVPYAVRRVARIVPGYWVALTAAALLQPLSYVLTLHGVIRYYGFLQLYQPYYPARGIGPAWTLCVEVTFYAALPLIGLAVRRLASRRAFLPSELTMCASLLVVSVAWQVLIFHVRPAGWWELSLLYVLPGTIGMFAAGMALAALSVSLAHRPDRPGWISAVDRVPWAPWLVALALLYAAGRMFHLAYTHYELWWVATVLLKTASAALLLLPLIFGSRHRDLMRRALGSRPLLYLGTISYGIYLWHLPLLYELQPRLIHHGELFTAVALTAITLVVASLSYYLIERPAQRLARRWLAARRARIERERGDPAAVARRRFRTVLILAGVLAVTVRLVVIIASPGFAPAGDAASYDDAAVSLASTGTFEKTCICFVPDGGPSAFRPPAYPYLLAGTYAATGTTHSHRRLTVARLTNAALAVVTVELIAMLALLLWDRRVAAVAAIAAAVYPPFLMIDSTTLTESLFLPLELGAIVAVLMHRRSSHRYRWALVAGLLAGLAALTRGNGLLLLVPLAIGVVTVTPSRGRTAAIRSAIALVGVALVVVSPWTIRNAEVLHAFIPVTDETGYTLAGLYNPVSYSRHMAWEVPVADLTALRRRGIDEVQWNSDLTRDAEHFVEHHPIAVPEAAFWNTLRLFDLFQPGRDITLDRTLGAAPVLTTLATYAAYPVLLLVILGLFSPVRRRVPLFIWVAVVLFALTTALSTVGGARYRLPIDPILLVLAAAAAVRLWERLHVSERIALVRTRVAPATR